MAKFVILFICLAVIISYVNCANITPEQMEILVAARDFCEKEHLTPRELIDKAKKGELVNDPTLKNFLFCWLKKISFMNDAGGFNLPTVKSTLLEVFSDGQNLYDKCSGIDEGSGPENAFKFAVCFHEHATDHFVEEQY